MSISSSVRGNGQSPSGSLSAPAVEPDLLLRQAIDRRGVFGVLDQFRCILRDDKTIITFVFDVGGDEADKLDHGVDWIDAFRRAASTTFSSE